MPTTPDPWWPRFLAETVVSRGSITYSGLDVVLAGVLDADWASCETQAATPPDDTVEDDAVRAEVVSFRYRHRLISAADLRGWLDDRELTVADLERYAARRLTGPTSPDRRPDLHDLHVQAACNGALTAAVEALRDRVVALGVEPEGEAALAPSALTEWLATSPLPELVDTETLRAATDRALQLDGARRRLGARVGAPAAIARCVAEHADDWVRVELDVLDFDGEGAAREAGLLLAEGAEPDHLAMHATGSGPAEFLVGEAPDGLELELLRTRGEARPVVWNDDEGWHTALVTARTPPEVDDPDVVERALAELLAVELGRVGAGRVRVHVDV